MSYSYDAPSVGTSRPACPGDHVWPTADGSPPTTSLVIRARPAVRQALSRRGSRGAGHDIINASGTFVYAHGSNYVTGTWSRAPSGRSSSSSSTTAHRCRWRRARRLSSCPARRQRYGSAEPWRCVVGRVAGVQSRRVSGRRRTTVDQSVDQPRRDGVGQARPDSGSPSGHLSAGQRPTHSHLQLAGPGSAIHRRRLRGGRADARRHTAARGAGARTRRRCARRRPRGRRRR